MQEPSIVNLSRFSRRGSDVRVYVWGRCGAGRLRHQLALTPLNALFAAGGVTPRGHFARLNTSWQAARGRGRAYDLLLHGVRSDMRRLEMATRARASSGPQVTVDGMVRRPAIYELHGESSLRTVARNWRVNPSKLRRCGTLKSSAVEAHEKRTMLSLDLSPGGDADFSQEANSMPSRSNDGDQVQHLSDSPYNEDSILQLQGHILRPGRYSTSKG